jgi:hypothetical protein
MYEKGNIVSSLLLFQRGMKGGFSSRCQILDLTRFGFVYHKPTKWQNGVLPPR